MIREYKIKEVLGTGAYGIIYKVVNMITNQIFVIKQISLVNLTPKQIDNVKLEAKLLSLINSIYVVKYYDSFEENKYLNIVMEYCDGGDLSEFIQRNKETHFLLKEDLIWNIFLKITIGLATMHQLNILHRDLKPQNIFLTKKLEVKIGDLGVARSLTKKTLLKKVIGTPYYLSPELCDKKSYNYKSDVWALGCILYELCTYNHPFNAKCQASLVLKILQNNPEHIDNIYSNELKQLLNLIFDKNHLTRPSCFDILNLRFVLEKAQKIGIIDKITNLYQKNRIKNIIIPNNCENKTSKEFHDINTEKIMSEKKLNENQFKKKKFEDKIENIKRIMENYDNKDNKKKANSQKIFKINNKKYNNINKNKNYDSYNPASSKLKFDERLDDTNTMLKNKNKCNISNNNNNNIKEIKIKKKAKKNSFQFEEKMDNNKKKKISALKKQMKFVNKTRTPNKSKESILKGNLFSKLNPKGIMKNERINVLIKKGSEKFENNKRITNTKESTKNNIQIQKSTKNANKHKPLKNLKNNSHRYIIKKSISSSSVFCRTNSSISTSARNNSNEHKKIHKIDNKFNNISNKMNYPVNFSLNLNNNGTYYEKLVSNIINSEGNYNKQNENENKSEAIKKINQNKNLRYSNKNENYTEKKFFDDYKDNKIVHFVNLNGLTNINFDGLKSNDHRYYYLRNKIADNQMNLNNMLFENQINL